MTGIAAKSHGRTVSRRLSGNCWVRTLPRVAIRGSMYSRIERPRPRAPLDPQPAAAGFPGWRVERTHRGPGARRIVLGGRIGCVPCRAEPPLRRSRHPRELPGPCPQVASPQLRAARRADSRRSRARQRAGCDALHHGANIPVSYQVLARKWRPPQLRAARRAGPCRACARQCAGCGSAPPRLPLHRHPRGRQDDARAHPRQVHQLRRPASTSTAVRRVRRVCRDRRGPVRRSAGGGRGVALEGGRDPRSHGQRPVHAGPGPLQGVPHRRGAHVLGEELQRAAEDAGGAAAAREVPARDDGPPEASDHGALAVPEVQPQATAGRRHRRPPRADPRRGSDRVRIGGGAARLAGRRTGACAMR